MTIIWSELGKESSSKNHCLALVDKTVVMKLSVKIKLYERFNFITLDKYDKLFWNKGIEKVRNISFFNVFLVCYSSNGEPRAQVPQIERWRICFSLSLSFSLLNRKKKNYRSIIKKKFIGRYLSFYLCMLLENVICLFF